MLKCDKMNTESVSKLLFPPKHMHSPHNIQLIQFLDSVYRWQLMCLYSDKEVFVQQSPLPQVIFAPIIFCLAMSYVVVYVHICVCSACLYLKRVACTSLQSTCMFVHFGAGRIYRKSTEMFQRFNKRYNTCMHKRFLFFLAGRVNYLNILKG